MQDLNQVEKIIEKDNIKKRTRKKSSYKKINNNIRHRLIEMVK